MALRRASTAFREHPLDDYLREFQRAERRTATPGRIGAHADGVVAGVALYCWGAHFWFCGEVSWGF